MIDSVGDDFVVHRDEVESIHIHMGEVAQLRRMDLELPGEQPLWVDRSTLPDGPTRPPVVLIHGFAQNRFSWDTKTRSLSGWLAAQGWDVWNLELRGHGRSRRRGGTKATMFSDYPDDLLRLADAMSEKAFWIGHSLGASVSYAAVADAHEAPPTRGVIGIGGLYRFGQAGWILPTASRITRKFPLAINLGDIQVHTGLSGRIMARLFPLVDMAAYGMPIAGWWPGSVEPELAKERMRRGFDYIPVRVWQEMASWIEADNVPWDEGWRKAKTPCLVILGDRDSMLFPEEGKAAYERAGGEDKTLRIFDDRDGLTHWGHLDIVLGKHAPDHVWPTMHQWLLERI
jgi:pimeloyl-ACP methyl ester carboxylesterase